MSHDAFHTAKVPSGLTDKTDKSASVSSVSAPAQQFIDSARAPIDWSLLRCIHKTLKELEERGLRIGIEGEKVQVHGPRRLLTEEVRRLVCARKLEIIAVLTVRDVPSEVPGIVYCRQGGVKVANPIELPEGACEGTDTVASAPPGEHLDISRQRGGGQ